MITKSTLLISAILIFFSTALLAQPEKFEYTSEDENMSITFPAAFNATNEEVDDIKTVKINAEYKGHTFFASYTIHAASIDDHDQMANYSLDAFVETLAGTAEQKSAWKNSGNTGLEAIMTFDEERNKVDYRVIFNGNVQYQIVVAGSNEGWDNKISEAFFKSFKIIK